MEIVAKQPFEQLAYQSGNEYVVEVSPKKEDKLKGKSAEPEYSGSRVTFNFQDIQGVLAKVRKSLIAVPSP